MPDLLFLDERYSLDPEKVEELLELSFLGKEGARGLDAGLRISRPPGSWQADLFAEDLFLDELIHSAFKVEIEGLRFPINHGFVQQVLSAPPTDPEEIRFRQEILSELDDRPEILELTRKLYRQVAVLLDMFKAPDHAAQLDINAYRLDMLKQARSVIELMASGFADVRSGLQRLHQRGREIVESDYYQTLCSLLDFEARHSTLTVSLNVGADGEIKELRLLDIQENSENPFHHSLGRQWWLRFKAAISGYNLGRKSIVQRVLHRVFEELSPALVPLVQIGAHLEVYLATLGFRDRLQAAGLPACLATLVDDQAVQLRDLSNPLLLAEPSPPIPCAVELHSPRTLTLVTGPNSGGKTRLLQSLGLAQLLGQSGLYVPASAARLPIVKGMFVSLVETETADQAEGRLGRELLRIRNLFARVGSPSLVILDELCSGTNPAEGVEIFSLVLDLLERMGATAFISTHFLDYVQGLREEPEIKGLRFLQVEPAGENRSTYQFVKGVAASSLARETAQRLGVTFEELSELIDRRLEVDGVSPRSKDQKPALRLDAEPFPDPATDTVSR